MFRDIKKNPFVYFIAFNIIELISLWTEGYSVDTSASAIQVTQVATEAIFSLVKHFMIWIMINFILIAGYRCFKYLEKIRNQSTKAEVSSSELSSNA